MNVQLESNERMKSDDEEMAVQLYNPISGEWTNELPGDFLLRNLSTPRMYAEAVARFGEKNVRLVKFRTIVIEQRVVNEVEAEYA